MAETFLQRTRRTRRLFLNTPSFQEWRLHLSLWLQRHFSLGATVSVAPFSGREESDIYLQVDLGWLEVTLGAENNPY